MNKIKNIIAITGHVTQEQEKMYTGGYRVLTCMLMTSSTWHKLLKLPYFFIAVMKIIVHVFVIISDQLSSLIN